MKLLKKTKKYLHVRLSPEELSLLDRAIKKDAADKEKERKLLEYAEWFYTNHIDISWQDEYSSWHTEWRNIHTKETVSQGREPDMFVRTYQHRYRNIIDKNKKKLGY
jgi:hypothetical protein